MKIFYIANVRMPTEKAHGVAIAKSCEAFARAGVDTELVVPTRHTPIKRSVFDHYGVENSFSIRYLPSIDLIRENAGVLVFMIQSATFAVSLILYVLFKSRSTILFTRDPAVILLSLLGFKVVFECHLISKNRDAFFSMARRAHKVIVISEALKTSFIDAGFTSDSVLVAPSGVDLSIFDIETSQEEARKVLDLPALGFIGVYTGNFTTMGQDKGISDIMKALPSAPRVTFVAAGGNDRDREQYEREARDAGVSERVILRGSTTQRMLALYQKAADVLLMPFPDTPHYRNHMSPVKMFEYMAGKRAIIASDLPTIREVLSEENAIIVPANDPESLAKAFQMLASEPERGERLAVRAYADVHTFSWSARTQRILAWLGAEISV